MKRAYKCIINVTLFNVLLDTKLTKNITRTVVAESEEAAIEKCNDGSTPGMVVSTFYARDEQKYIEVTINSVNVNA
jgi:hypothetical protein